MGSRGHYGSRDGETNEPSASKGYSKSSSDANLAEGAAKSPRQSRGLRLRTERITRRRSAGRQTDGWIGGIQIVVFHPAGVHETRGEEWQGGREHQLRVNAHELGDPDGRLLGLLQVM